MAATQHSPVSSRLTEPNHPKHRGWHISDAAGCICEVIISQACSSETGHYNLKLAAHCLANREIKETSESFYQVGWPLRYLFPSQRTALAGHRCTLVTGMNCRISVKFCSHGAFAERQIRSNRNFTQRPIEETRPEALDTDRFRTWSTTYRVSCSLRSSMVVQVSNEQLESERNHFH